MTDPIAVIVDVVGRIEPEMAPESVAAAARNVVTSRAGRRKLAKALEDNPSLLTSGRTEGPPMVDRLIHLLRDRGAVGVVQPCCAGCGKPARAMRAHNDDRLRICVTCNNKALGTFAPRPCAVCRRNVIPRFYDRHRQPLCGKCPPDPGVDHLEVICDQIMMVSPGSDRDQIRAVIGSTVRQTARRRQIAWALQDRPSLLVGEAADGSLSIRRLIAALTEHGVTGLVNPACPFCTMIRPLKALREGRPCCDSCSQAARATACVRCHAVKAVSTRTHAAEPLCWACSLQEESNKETCSSCGQFTAIATHRGERAVCFSCRTTPSATCSVCGLHKPCTGAGTPTPRCLNCAHRARSAQCVRCGKVHPIAGRDAHGNELCGNCAKRREPCCRCGRRRPVEGRVLGEPVCWTCIKTEPSYFRACSECATVSRLRHHGLCDICAAPRALDAALSAPDGNMRPELMMVRHALATSNPATLLDWLHRSTTKPMLAMLAAGEGPVTHRTLDQLVPAGPARYLRQVLVARKALPEYDRHLNDLERWFDDKLREVDDPGERRALRGYLTWSHLRRLRKATTPTTPHAAASIRGEIKSAIKLLGWLRARGRTLHTCTQSDIDHWCMQGGRMPYRARLFLAWCTQRGHTGAVQIPVASGIEARTGFDCVDTRWQLARRLLHDDTIAVADRVAGLLVLLYGQNASKIARLRTDDVACSDEHVSLLLGRCPIELPTPLDKLVLDLAATRRGKASLGHTDNHNWLFPGGLPAQAIHPAALARRLAALGVSVRTARNTALMDNASSMPTKLLSDLLGLSTTGATRWSALASPSTDTYAADLVRRRTPDPTSGPQAAAPEK
ncbi:hypothetical protein GS530_24425 [Rhodococcus hoagii]|nr:hypothetical protein [Prescottella equi]